MDRQSLDAADDATEVGLHLVHSLAGLARTLSADHDSFEVLLHLVEHITDAFEITATGVTVEENDAVKFLASGHAVMTELELIQHEGRTGPGFDAMETGRVVSVADIRESDEARAWGRFTEHAVEAGIVAVAAIPLSNGKETVGSVHLYHSEPHAWSKRDLTVAGAMADVAVSHMRHLSELHHQRQLAQQLQVALDSRVVIEQAKGMLDADKGLDVEESFHVLRNYARKRGLRLHGVAVDVVERQLHL